MLRKVGLISVFARHPNAANLLMALLIIIGIYSLGVLNRQVMPHVGLDAVSASFVWPGASAEDVESNILKAVEPEIRFIDGVKRVNGTAFEGRGSFFIEFQEGTDMSRAFSDVENGISRVTTLPEDMERPVITQTIFYETVSRVALSGPFPESALKAIAKDMRDDLLDRGADKVRIEGLRDDEIWVEVSPATLRRLDLTLGEISEKIANVSVDRPSGTLEGGYERQIRSLGLRKTVESMGDIEVRSRQDGEKIYLDEIATIRDTFDDDQPYGYFQGNRALSIEVLRARSSDTIEIAELVDTYLAEVGPTLPASLNVTQYDVRADFVKERIWLLVKNGLGGLLLVLCVLFLFLSGRLAFWVAAGVPIAMLATFGAMVVTGQTINMVSLMALIMTLGIVVDDAIVVGEHAASRREMGMSPLDAAESGATRMFGPVMASSLTTIAAFLPILMVSDMIGQIISALPYVVVAVIIASLIECFLILPGHLRGALKHGASRVSGFRGRFNERFNRFRDTRFIDFVSLTFSRRYTTIAAAFAALIVGIGLIVGGRVPFTFFPEAESETMTANVTMVPGTPRGETEQMLAEMERALRAAEDQLTDGTGGLIEASFGSIGRSKSRESWMEMNADNMAGMWVELAPSDMREVRNPEIIAAWKQEIRSLPGLERVTVTEMVGGPPGEPIDIRLSGADISTLKQASLEVQELLERFAGLRDIDDDLPYGKQELIVELTPRGTAMGFTTESVSRQIRNASEGAIAKRFPRGDEEVLVRVQYPEGQFNAETLRELYLRNPEGVEVPLMEVVNLRESQGFSRIRRQDGITEVAVTANLNTEVTNTNRVLNALPEQGLDEIARKYSIDYTFRGKAEEQARSFGEVGTGFLIAMAAIYIILAWVLGSYALPVVVMTIIPFGLVGAVLGHLVLGYDMSIMSIIGLLGLSGILVNDSIILVSTIQERVSHGEKWDDAIIEGTRDRFRAVMLTSLTTIGGLTPLLFETSLQAQFLMPIAITLVFGIAMATLIVLIVVPSLMGVVRDVRAFHISLRRGTAFGSTRRRRSRPGSAAPETGAE